MNLSSLHQSFPSLYQQPANGSAQGATRQQEAGGKARDASDPLIRASDIMQKRVDQMQGAMGDMALGLAQGFAQSLLGSAAEGASIQFDETAIASRSRFSAAAFNRTDENGQLRAAGFQLEDTSEFTGRGTITTADGRTFEFELEIRYSASLTSLAAERRSGGEAVPTTVGDGNRLPLSADFAGSAVDLLDRLTSEPVRLPFALTWNPASEDQSALAGDMAMRILGLPGGERYLDWLPDWQGDQGGVDMRV